VQKVDPVSYWIPGDQMAAGNQKLSDSVVEQCLVRQGQGYTYDAIREWLFNEYQVKVTTQCLSRRINNLRKQRAEMTASAVSNIVAKKVTADLDAMDELIKRALDDELRARGIAWNLGTDAQGAPTTSTISGSEIWSRLMHVVKASRGTLMDALALRLKLAGAEDKNKSSADPEEVKNRLMAKIDDLVEKAGNFKRTELVKTPTFLQ